MAKAPKRKAARASDSPRSSEFLDARTSERILKIVKAQQQEEADEDVAPEPASMVPKATLQPVAPAGDGFGEDDEAESDDDAQADLDEYNAMLEIQVEPEQMAIMEKFMKAGPSLASETIADKIAAAERKAFSENAGSQPVKSTLNEKVVEVYKKIGLLLSRYKSGKLPKTFKIVPTLPNWLDILMITEPENWTPHATFEATKLFTSNLKTNQAVQFFELVLLDKVRYDIYENKNLNYHLYMALKKAFYKPSAFFKGIIVPLCTQGGCTLREAVIIGSIVSKTSIPMLHSAACLLKIAELPYTGANSLFIRVLLDKKYALPFRVVDSLVFHFLGCKHDPRGEMPVLWHQSLLVFAQRYKMDMTREQKDSLLDLIRVQVHKDITPEVRRELTSGGEREADMEMEM